MSDKIGIALLAAGRGTRTKLELPKVLLPLVGKKLIDYPLMAVESFLTQNRLNPYWGVILGHKKDEVEGALKAYQTQHKNWITVHQKDQRGTADALMAWQEQCPWVKELDLVLVICGDTPLLTAEILQKLHQEMKTHSNCDAVVATFELKNPHGYGRVIRSGHGFKIVEEKEASPEQKKISEVNSGLYLIKRSFLVENLKKISNKNNTSEFYLTDLFQADRSVRACLFDNPQDFAGVNTLEQLAQAGKVLQERKLRQLMEAGVIVVDPANSYVDWDVKVGVGSYLAPGCHLQGKTVIAESVWLENNVVLKDCTVEARAKILSFSHLEQAVVRSEASVGPFARLRPEAVIGSGAKIGNFVEIKKSNIGQGSKVSHLSYVGDAEVGKEANIGCGFITCNYDGKKKHKTTIGDGSFIGSDCQAIAPISIGNHSFVAAGSTLTQDVPDGAFAISRGRQVTKDGMAQKFLPKKT